MTTNQQLIYNFIIRNGGVSYSELYNEFNLASWELNGVLESLWKDSIIEYDNFLGYTISKCEIRDILINKIIK